MSGILSFRQPLRGCHLPRQGKVNRFAAAQIPPRCRRWERPLPRVPQICFAPNLPTVGRAKILSVICHREAAANDSSPYFKGSRVRALPRRAKISPQREARAERLGGNAIPCHGFSLSVSHSVAATFPVRGRSTASRQHKFRRGVGGGKDRSRVCHRFALHPIYPQ